MKKWRFWIYSYSYSYYSYYYYYYYYNYYYKNTALVVCLVIIVDVHLSPLTCPPALPFFCSPYLSYVALRIYVCMWAFFFGTVVVALLFDWPLGASAQQQKERNWLNLVLPGEKQETTQKSLGYSALGIHLRRYWDVVCAVYRDPLRMYRFNSWDTSPSTTLNNVQRVTWVTLFSLAASIDAVSTQHNKRELKRQHNNF